MATCKGQTMKALVGREGHRDLEAEVKESRPSPPGTFVHPCLHGQLGEAWEVRRGAETRNSVAGLGCLGPFVRARTSLFTWLSPLF